MDEYTWNKKEIFKIALGNLNCKNQKGINKLDLLIDKENLKDMILYSILGLPEVSIPKIDAKKYLDYDRCFLKEETTYFQRKIIDSQIKTVSGALIKLSESEVTYDYNNMVEHSLDFLSGISPELYDLLKKSIEDRTLSIKNNHFSKDFCGITYFLSNKSYYEVLLKSYSNPFIALNHELMHGYVSLVSNRKFDKTKKSILYREVGSLLIEIYSNEYLLRNKLISYDEYVTNFSDILLVTMYNDIEIIDILFSLATNTELENSRHAVKKFIDDKAIENPNYNVGIRDLFQYPLKFHLICMYSALIAIGLYNNFKDDGKKALKAATDIMINVKPSCEEELFKKYELNITESLNNFIEENNNLVKKKNS